MNVAEMSRLAGRAIQFLDLDLDGRIKFANDCANAASPQDIPSPSQHQFHVGLALAIEAGHEIPGAEEALTAAAFGKPNQPRDYHGRWGQGGSRSVKSGKSAYDHVAENQGRVTDPAQIAALDAYVDDSSTFNDSLRERKSKVTIDKQSRKLERAIRDNGAITTDPILVHRAVSDAAEVFGTKDLTTLKGAKITDYGFMSTTTDRDVAEEFRYGTNSAIMNITITRQTKVLAIDSAISKPGGESELLLTNGHVLQVNDVSRDSSGWNIEAELIR